VPPASPARSTSPARTAGDAEQTQARQATKPVPSTTGVAAASSSSALAIVPVRPPDDTEQVRSAAELFQRGYEAYQKRDYAGAAQLYKAGADKGDANCMQALGFIYAQGLGVSVDYNSAQSWYQRAADHGKKAALYNIALLYWQGGPGIARNVPEAVRKLRLSAEAGFTTAAWMIGRIYRDGDGVSRDVAEAIRWFQKAADQGYVDAMTELGGLYATGQSIPRDCAAAHRWFALAAQHGSRQAETWLAANQSCS
jgi:TPR repeat protein